MIQWNGQTAQAYSNLGEQSHVAILHDALLPLMTPVHGLSLLDFGCGEGRLAARLAAHGARRVVCVDRSEELLRSAREQMAQLPPPGSKQVEFLLDDETMLPTDDSFDLVLCSLMLMMLPTRKQLDDTVRGLILSTAPTGRLLLVVTHPCFREATHATFHNRLPENFSYWRSGTSYDVVMDPAERQVRAALSDFHWTLSDYAAAIHHGGGIIETMHEAPGQLDDRGHPTGDPAYLIFVVR